MQRLSLSPQTSAAILTVVRDCLAGGGVVAAPTETVYGLMAHYAHAEARERIFRMKRRAPEKHLQMLANSVATAAAAGLVPGSRLEALARAFWPGPLTVVCPAAGGGTIGLRIPRGFAGDLTAILQFPLAATSANLSGRPAARDADAAIAELEELPDLLVDGGPVPDDGGLASTVVDITGPEVRLLRAGPITAEQVLGALGLPHCR